MSENTKQELTDFGLQLDGLTSTYSDQYKAETQGKNVSDDTVETFIHDNKDKIDGDIEKIKSEKLSPKVQESKPDEIKVAVEGFFKQLTEYLKSIPNL